MSETRKLHQSIQATTQTDLRAHDVKLHERETELRKARREQREREQVPPMETNNSSPGKQAHLTITPADREAETKVHPRSKRGFMKRSEEKCQEDLKAMQAALKRFGERGPRKYSLTKLSDGKFGLKRSTSELSNDSTAAVAGSTTSETPGETYEPEQSQDVQTK
jgi:hypothetical protein